jgi:hypothetical protein
MWLIYPALSCHIPDYKFFFLPGRDITLQPLRLTEYITETFNELAYTAALLLDVANAYGTIWTTGLI